jgi:toxin ParE1/3/4
MKQVRLRLEAELELLEATVWYETEREGLGFEFDEEVHAALGRVANGPKHFPVIARDIRRAIVDRFPYGVFFVEFDDVISVIGVLHLHRDPATWQSR